MSLFDRLKEGSTWAGIAAIFGTLAHLLPQYSQPAATLAILSGTIAGVLPDSGGQQSISPVTVNSNPMPVAQPQTQLPQMVQPLQQQTTPQPIAIDPQTLANAIQLLQASQNQYQNNAITASPNG